MSAPIFPPPLPHATPPPLPQEAPPQWSQDELNAYLDRPLRSGGVPMPGTEGLTLRDVEQDILKGGRFIIHHWCVSIILLTFTRTTPVRYFRSWQSGFGQAALYSFISMCFGWWGIPSGLIFTPICLWRNSRGGTDVTPEILERILGPTRAQSVLSKAAPRRTDLAHGLLLVLGLLPPLGLILLIIMSAR